MSQGVQVLSPLFSVKGLGFTAPTQVSVDGLHWSLPSPLRVYFSNFPDSVVRVSPSNASTQGKQQTLIPTQPVCCPSGGFDSSLNYHKRVEA